MEDSSTYHIATTVSPSPLVYCQEAHSNSAQAYRNSSQRLHSNSVKPLPTSQVQPKGGSLHQPPLTMVSPPRKKGRVSPHLFEHVFANPLAEAEAELEAEAAAAAAAAAASAAAQPPKQPTKARKVRQRKSAELVDELKKTAQEVVPEEKEVFIVREPEEEQQPEQRRGRGRPRGAGRGRGRGRGNGHAATTQSPEKPKEPTIEDRLPYGFPEEGKANRPISEQSGLVSRCHWIYDPYMNPYCLRYD